MDKKNIFVYTNKEGFEPHKMKCVICQNTLFKIQSRELIFLDKKYKKRSKCCTKGFLCVSCGFINNMAQRGVYLKNPSDKTNKQAIDGPLYNIIIDEAKDITDNYLLFPLMGIKGDLFSPESYLVPKSGGGHTLNCPCCQTLNIKDSYNRKPFRGFIEIANYSHLEDNESFLTSYITEYNPKTIKKILEIKKTASKSGEPLDNLIDKIFKKLDDKSCCDNKMADISTSIQTAIMLSQLGGGPSSNIESMPLIQQAAILTDPKTFLSPRGLIFTMFLDQLGIKVPASIINAPGAIMSFLTGPIGISLIISAIILYTIRLSIKQYQYFITYERLKYLDSFSWKDIYNFEKPTLTKIQRQYRTIMSYRETNNLLCKTCGYIQGYKCIKNFEPEIKDLLLLEIYNLLNQSNLYTPPKNIILNNLKKFHIQELYEIHSLILNNNYKVQVEVEKGKKNIGTLVNDSGVNLSDDRNYYVKIDDEIKLYRGNQLRVLYDRNYITEYIVLLFNEYEDHVTKRFGGPNKLIKQLLLRSKNFTKLVKLNGWLDLYNLNKNILNNQPIYKLVDERIITKYLYNKLNKNKIISNFSNQNYLVDTIEKIKQDFQKKKIIGQGGGSGNRWRRNSKKNVTQGEGHHHFEDLDKTTNQKNYKLKADMLISSLSISYSKKNIREIQQIINNNLLTIQQLLNEIDDWKNLDQLVRNPDEVQKYNDYVNKLSSLISPLLLFDKDTIYDDSIASNTFIKTIKNKCQDQITNKLVYIPYIEGKLVKDIIKAYHSNTKPDFQDNYIDFISLKRVKYLRNQNKVFSYNGLKLKEKLSFISNFTENPEYTHNKNYYLVGLLIITNLIFIKQVYNDIDIQQLDIDIPLDQVEFNNTLKNEKIFSINIINIKPYEYFYYHSSANYIINQFKKNKSILLENDIEQVNIDNEKKEEQPEVKKEEVDLDGQTEFKNIYDTIYDLISAILNIFSKLDKLDIQKPFGINNFNCLNSNSINTTFKKLDNLMNLFTTNFKIFINYLNNLKKTSNSSFLVKGVSHINKIFSNKNIESQIKVITKYYHFIKDIFNVYLKYTSYFINKLFIEKNINREVDIPKLLLPFNEIDEIQDLNNSVEKKEENIIFCQYDVLDNKPEWNSLINSKWYVNYDKIKLDINTDSLEVNKNSINLKDVSVEINDKIENFSNLLKKFLTILDYPYKNENKTYTTIFRKFIYSMQTRKKSITLKKNLENESLKRVDYYEDYLNNIDIMLNSSLNIFLTILINLIDTIKDTESKVLDLTYNKLVLEDKQRGGNIISLDKETISFDNNYQDGGNLNRFIKKLKLQSPFKAEKEMNKLTNTCLDFIYDKDIKSLRKKIISLNIYSNIISYGIYGEKPVSKITDFKEKNQDLGLSDKFLYQYFFTKQEIIKVILDLLVEIVKKYNLEYTHISQNIKNLNYNYDYTQIKKINDKWGDIISNIKKDIYKYIKDNKISNNLILDIFKFDNKVEIGNTEFNEILCSNQKTKNILSEKYSILIDQESNNQNHNQTNNDLLLEKLSKVIDLDNNGCNNKLDTDTSQLPSIEEFKREAMGGKKYINNRVVDIQDQIEILQKNIVLDSSVPLFVFQEGGESMNNLSLSIVNSLNNSDSIREIRSYLFKISLQMSDILNKMINLTESECIFMNNFISYLYYINNGIFNIFSQKDELEDRSKNVNDLIISKKNLEDNKSICFNIIDNLSCLSFEKSVLIGYLKNKNLMINNLVTNTHLQFIKENKNMIYSEYYQCCPNCKNITFKMSVKWGNIYSVIDTTQVDKYITNKNLMKKMYSSLFKNSNDVLDEKISESKEKGRMMRRWQGLFFDSFRKYLKNFFKVGNGTIIYHCINCGLELPFAWKNNVEFYFMDPYTRKIMENEYLNMK